MQLFEDFMRSAFGALLMFMTVLVAYAISGVVRDYLRGRFKK